MKTDFSVENLSPCDVSVVCRVQKDENQGDGNCTDEEQKEPEMEVNKGVFSTDPALQPVEDRRDGVGYECGPVKYAGHLKK